VTDIKPKIIYIINLMYHINITQYILVTLTTRKWHMTHYWEMPWSLTYKAAPTCLHSYFQGTKGKETHILFVYREFPNLHENPSAYVSVMHICSF